MQLTPHQWIALGIVAVAALIAVPAIVAGAGDHPITATALTVQPRGAPEPVAARAAIAPLAAGLDRPERNPYTMRRSGDMFVTKVPPPPPPTLALPAPPVLPLPEDGP